MAKIVKFEDGTYGIRRGWLLFWLYRDLVTPCFSWSRGSEFFHRSCRGTLSRCIEVLPYNGDQDTGVSKEELKLCQ